MKNSIKTLLVCGLLIVVSCAKDNTFSITADSVGKLHKTDLVENLETVFEGDSVVSETFEENNELRSKRIKIFEKGGNLLMTLTPNQDSVQTVENIRIEDPRFTSEKGVGLSSTFKDINDKYTIDKIITALNNIVVTVKESDIYFTISKDELPENLRFSTNPVEAVQIPDDAKLKYVMVSWAN